MPDHEAAASKQPTEQVTEPDTLSLASRPQMPGNENATLDDPRNVKPQLSNTSPDLVVPGYQIIDKLGCGAMGVVYKALHIRLNRIVALKMILHRDHVGLEQKVRFQIEAEAIARLVHPNIVQLYEVGESNGHPYFSLELCEGGPVDRKLKSWRPSPAEAAEMVATLARAMHYAHLRGVVHRDLKPANVLVDNEGRLKITDFGLAKKTDGGSHVSQSGAIMGTPSYMAPEQAAGRVHDTGPAADIYALGVFLYELLAGRPPFVGTAIFDTLRLVLNQEPPPPSRSRPGVPRDLETICLKCLRKEPASRYSSAEALADDLQRFLNGEPITARPVGTGERLIKWMRRNPGVTALLVSLAAVVLVSFLVLNRQLEKTKSALVLKDREQEQRKKAEMERVLARIEALTDAAPGAVPALLVELSATRDEALPHLRRLWSDNPERTQRRMRAGLAMLPSDPDAVRDELVNWLLDVDDPAEVLLVRNALEPYAEQVRDRCWNRAEDKKLDPNDRFRALVALAAFDPKSRRWEKQASMAVASLLSANRLHLGTWVKGLQPVRATLLQPLAKVFRTAPSADVRELAAHVLLVYAGDRNDFLVDLLLDSDPGQFAVLFPKLRAVELLAGRLHDELAEECPFEDDVCRRRQAIRQANAAIALMLMGCDDCVWRLFRHAADPSRRSELLARLAAFGIKPDLIAHRLLDDRELDKSARRALILALGDYTAAQMPHEMRQSLTRLFLRWYAEDPDPGIHGAIDWLLRHGSEGSSPRPLDWKQEARLKAIDAALSRRDPDGRHGWYVNQNGNTMIVIAGPVEFRMGSAPSEGTQRIEQTPHRRRIARSFSIAAKSITVAEFDHFLRDRPDVTRPAVKNVYGPDDECPVIGISWYMAAQYCNWLSEKEGIPESQWCYPRHENIKDGMRPIPGYLARTGYRLPTEAEWEYAARAKATTRMYFGDSLDLLSRYAWCFDNSGGRARPVGEKRPNDFGMFDAHGNVWNWIQGSIRPYEIGDGDKAIEDEEDHAVLNESIFFGLRGGSYANQPMHLRAGYRNFHPPGDRLNTVGFRIARTIGGNDEH